MGRRGVEPAKVVAVLVPLFACVGRHGSADWEYVLSVGTVSWVAK